MAVSLTTCCVAPSARRAPSASPLFGRGQANLPLHSSFRREGKRRSTIAMVSASAASCLVVASAAANRCLAFQPGPPKLPTVRRRGIGIGPLRAELRASEESAHATAASLDPDIASQFTIQVCTSTNCSRRLNEAGLDKYHALGELYARAQAANVEKCVIVEDGTCQGGRNCKMGPCVAIQHEDFDGNVALEGMNSNEFRERVFHNVLTDGDSERVWSCVENAITMMTEEES